MLYIAKVKSLSVTPSGGSAINVKGVKSIAINVDHGMLKEYDADDEIPFFYKGQRSRSIEIELRDYELAMALQDTGCVSSLTAVLAAPVAACSTGGPADALTLTATNLAVTGVVPINADSSGTPTAYSVTLEQGHNDAGTAGTWSFTPAGGGGED